MLPSQPNIRQRLAAAALSAVLPGAGQLLLGQRRKALLFFALLATTALAFFLLRLPAFYPGLISVVWMCLLLSVFAVCSAFFSRSAHTSARPSWWWLPLVLAFVYISINLIFTSLLVASGFRTLKFMSSSMEPTLSAGERFILDANYYHHHPPGRDDLVAIRRDGGVTVKRIIAIDGDTIEGKDRQIFRDGHSLSEPFIQHQLRVSGYTWLDTFGPVSVPAGKYFVIGDNRDISLDSRSPEIGLVDKQSIVGKPLYSYRLYGHPLSRRLD